MANFESSNFELNAADFGEPTPETRARFGRALESLKRLTVGVKYENKPVIIEGEQAEDMNILGGRLEIPAEPLPEGLGPITEYKYDQCDDPLFHKYEHTYFCFTIIEASPDTFTKWHAADDPYDKHIRSVYYSEGNLEMQYSLGRSGEETLEINKKLIEPDLPGFREAHQEFFWDRLQAFNSGVVIPTDGAMNRLINVIEQEVAKRVQ